MPVVPPVFSASIIFGKVFRFQCIAAVDAAITARDMASMLFVAASATQGFSLLGSIQLKKFRVWSPTTIGASVSCQLSQESTTFIGSKSQIWSDTCNSMTYPAKLQLKPKRGDLSGFVISGAANSTAHVVDVIASENSIFELHVVCVLLDLASPGQSLTIAGATPGVLYSPVLLGGNATPVAFPGLAYT